MVNMPKTNFSHKSSAKNTAATAAIVLLLFLPWTILILRTFPWALKSPAAEITISAYAAAMILMAAAAIVVYVKGHVRNNLMKAALVIHCIYGGFGMISLFFIIGGLIL